MKICVYGVSDKERPCFEKARREMGLQVELHREDPSLDSAHLAQGCTCVSILSIPAPAALLDACGGLAHVRVRGLMTMAPQGDLDAARATFEGLARLHAELRADLDPSRAALFDGLSMGMSEDWREAVHAGATIVRIGRAVFDDAFEASGPGAGNLA